MRTQVRNFERKRLMMKHNLHMSMRMAKQFFSFFFPLQMVPDRDV